MVTEKGSRKDLSKATVARIEKGRGPIVGLVDMLLIIMDT
jgi:hypothetical protein